MANVLPGWKGIAIDGVVVSDLSAAGGGRIFRVAAEGATPPTVVLRAPGKGARHYRDSEGAYLQDARTQAAANLLSTRGLAPRQLAVGGRWNIEAWGGESVARDFNHFDESLAPMEELAELMARFHSVPTDWFEEYRLKMITRDPSLETVCASPSNRRIGACGVPSLALPQVPGGELECLRLALSCTAGACSAARGRALLERRGVWLGEWNALHGWRAHTDESNYQRSHI